MDRIGSKTFGRMCHKLAVPCKVSGPFIVFTSSATSKTISGISIGSNQVFISFGYAQLSASSFTSKSTLTNEILNS